MNSKVKLKTYSAAKTTLSVKVEEEANTVDRYLCLMSMSSTEPQPPLIRLVAAAADAMWTAAATGAEGFVIACSSVGWSKILLTLGVIQALAIVKSGWHCCKRIHFRPATTDRATQTIGEVVTVDEVPSEAESAAASSSQGAETSNHRSESDPVRVRILNQYSDEQLEGLCHRLGIGYTTQRAAVIDRALRATHVITEPQASYLSNLRRKAGVPVWVPGVDDELFASKSRASSSITALT